MAAKMVANWRNPDFQFFVLLNFWVYAAVSVSSEGPAPLHVGSVSVGVASVRARGFVAQEKKRHHLRLAFLVHPRFLRSRSLKPRASSLASSPAWAGASSRGPLRLLRDCGGLSTVHARTGRASRLVVRGPGDPLRARRRTALWRVRGWSHQRGLVAAIHRQTRASLRALGNPAACELECSQALTPSLRNSIRRALKEATQKRLTNGSPSATQCFLFGCASRGSWMHRNRRANDAGWRRGRWPFQSCNIWDARQAQTFFRWSSHGQNQAISH